MPYQGEVKCFSCIHHDLVPAVGRNLVFHPRPFNNSVMISDESFALTLVCTSFSLRAPLLRALALAVDVALHGRKSRVTDFN